MTSWLGLKIFIEQKDNIIEETKAIKSKKNKSSKKTNKKKNSK